MSIGNKILDLRKKLNLSQEQLAEKLNVTRQTISKWELDETSPNISQAKELSKIFNVSLDELVDNEVKNILVEKVSNTEKLAGIIIKILKFVGITFLVLIVIEVIAFILFAALKQEPISSVVEEVTLTCSLNDKDYLITVGSDAYFNCSNCDKETHIYLNNNIDYSDIGKSSNMIEEYFNGKGGSCE